MTTDIVPFNERRVLYTPLAEAEEIALSVGMVRSYLAVRSRSGKTPGDADVMKFMMLCKSRLLNPFVGDAYLLGYDTQHGTQWSLITAIQALRKRAESNPQYDGCECGVIVQVQENGELVTDERDGTLVMDGETLIGGWARVHRKDRKVAEYRTVKFSTYDTGQSRWKKDPAGMITKVAEAAALRAAFPSDLGGMYLKDEFGGTGDDDQPTVDAPTTGLAGLRAKLETPVSDSLDPSGSPSSEPEAVEGVDLPHTDADAIQAAPDDAGEFVWGSEGEPPAKADK